MDYSDNSTNMVHYKKTFLIILLALMGLMAAFCQDQGKQVDFSVSKAEKGRYTISVAVFIPLEGTAFLKEASYVQLKDIRKPFLGTAIRRAERKAKRQARKNNHK